MRVCWFGTYERDYPRNRIAIDGLRRHDVEVIECHVEVWGLTRIKLAEYFRPRSLMRLALRYLAALARLVWLHSRIADYDVMVVGFNGHLDIPVARWLSRRRGKPLIVDPLVSLYNTLVEDKGFVATGSIAAAALAWLERRLYALADRVVSDTPAHAVYFRDRFGVPATKLATVLTGADDRIFRPLVKPRPRGPFRVLYYGKYLPLHGVRTMLEAARRLAHDDVAFTFVGTGQFRDEVRAVCGADEPDAIPNLTLIDWVPYAELPELIASADVCLGIFGGTRKADLVFPNKAFQALAMGKALVTGASGGMREVLGDVDCVSFVPMRDAAALADAIRDLARDPSRIEQLGAAALREFRSRMNLRSVGAAWTDLVYDVAGWRRVRRRELLAVASHRRQRRAVHVHQPRAEAPHVEA